MAKRRRASKVKTSGFKKFASGLRKELTGIKKNMQKGSKRSY